MGGRVGAWGQAGSSDLWLLARGEGGSGEGLQAQGSRDLLCSLQGLSAAHCWGWSVLLQRDAFLSHTQLHLCKITALPRPGCREGQLSQKRKWC